MGPVTIPIFPADPLPSQADTLVIGGGIIGVTAALFLAERGQNVVLVEKGHIAGEQSSRNWGWCRKCGRDPRELDLIRESLALWRGMSSRIGADTGFTTCGTFYAPKDASSEARFADWVKLAAEAGIKAEMLGAHEIEKLIPGSRLDSATGLYCADDGRAEPQWAVPRMALAARAQGASIITDCAARGIETAGGQVIGVVTEQGPIHCDAVVVAGGAWSRRILRDLDLHIPQLAVRSSVARTQAMPAGFDLCFSGDELGVRRRADGGFTIANGMASTAPITPDHFRFFADYLPLLAMEWRHIRFSLGPEFFTARASAHRTPLDQASPYEAVRVLDPKPDMRFLKAALANFRQLFPSMASARIVQAWAGMIDALPDAVPIISPVESIGGLVIATGFSGHGFGIGPAAGHLVADIVSGAPPIADPRPFRASRFAGGAKHKPYAGL